MKARRAPEVGASKAPRMLDVARLAGVSTATVSRVLAGSTTIQPELAEAVRRASSELGYTPNAMARSLRTQQTRTVIVVVPDISNAYFSLLLRGVEEQAHLAGYSVLIGNAANDPRREANYAQHVAARRADGLVVVSGRLPAVASENRVPVVVVSESIAGADLPTVRTDDVEAAKAAVNHLLELGHRRIACITGTAGSALTVDRVRGYRRALREAGITANGSLIVEGDFTIASGATAMGALLDAEGHRPTAVFACNDEMAIGAMQAARVRGLSVPLDLSVVGFDDIPFAASYDTPLTTMRQPFFEIGQAAMSMLLELLTFGSVRSGLKVIPSTLALRSSTARPPSSAN